MKSVRVEDLRQELRGQLESLKTGDFAPLWEDVGPLLRGSFEVNFVTTSSPHGGHWKPRKDNLPHPLLRKTFAMYFAATDRNAEGHIADYGRREMKEGIDSSVIVYAAAQNFGHDYGNRILPARRYIDVADGTIINIDPMVADFGLELLANKG